MCLGELLKDTARNVRSRGREDMFDQLTHQIHHKDDVTYVSIMHWPDQKIITSKCNINEKSVTVWSPFGVMAL